MKRTLLAFAALSAFAGAASAQSSAVTLSGNVDLGVVRQNGDWNMQNAASARTNFTLSGREDLGGGMSAFFHIQHRFNANTGVQRDGNAFWRQSWVGLQGGFGRLRLGKMTSPLQDYSGITDPFTVATVASVYTGGINAGNPLGAGTRYNNAIDYMTPSFGGLTLTALIAAADNNQGGAVNPQGPGTERPVGLGIRYAAGPFMVAAAYDRNGVDQKTKGIYGSFNAGFATFTAGWENGDVTGHPSGSDDVSRWLVGATVPMGAATLKAGYTKWKDDDLKKIGLGLEYALSKRTFLYTDVGKYSGNFVSSLAGLPGAVNTSLPTTPIGFGTADLVKKTRFDVGISHAF